MEKETRSCKVSRKAMTKSPALRRGGRRENCKKTARLKGITGKRRTIAGRSRRRTRTKEHWDGLKLNRTSCSAKKRGRREKKDKEKRRSPQTTALIKSVSKKTTICIISYLTRKSNRKSGGKPHISRVLNLFGGLVIDSNNSTKHEK